MTQLFRSVARMLLAVGATFCLFASSARAQTPTPTPGGDCCADHPGPGCDDVACRDCVCGLVDQEVCCAGVWDADCVAAASNACAANCACATVPTPTATGTPATPTPSPTPGGECCASHGAPGCDVSACQACVCELDSNCCSEIWDEYCVSRAADECNGSCACSGECCLARDTPGCKSAICTDCVCAIDSACCTAVWDQPCTERAVNPDECAGSCPCTPADCCAAGDTPGCESAVCIDCVCGIDPDCCTISWDQTCVEEAAGPMCAAKCPCNSGDCCAAHDSPGCDGALCVDCVCGLLDRACCDDAWDDRCAQEAAAACAGSCGCAAADCGVAREQPGCGDRNCLDCVCTIDPVCCADGWDATCAERTVDPLECADRCGANCCAPHQGAGCGDSACEACVCGMDPECCSGVWDQRCADEAANPDNCGSSCSCPPKGACCAANQTAGCNVAPCEACVCAFDAQCCSDVWDEFCAGEAATECAAECRCVGDCNGDCRVSIDELLLGVNMALGNRPPGDCFDASNDGQVDITELLQGVDNALNGCG